MHNHFSFRFVLEARTNFCLFLTFFRALEVFAQTGKPMSEVLMEQRSQEGGNELGGPLRYPHIIIFWLQCDQVRLKFKNFGFKSFVPFFNGFGEFENLNLEK